MGFVGFVYLGVCGFLGFIACDFLRGRPRTTIRTGTICRKAGNNMLFLAAASILIAIGLGIFCKFTVWEPERQQAEWNRFSKQRSIIRERAKAEVHKEAVERGYGTSEGGVFSWKETKSDIAMVGLDDARVAE